MVWTPEVLESEIAYRYDRLRAPSWRGWRDPQRRTPYGWLRRVVRGARRDG